MINWSDNMIWYALHIIVWLSIMNYSKSALFFLMDFMDLMITLTIFAVSNEETLCMHKKLKICLRWHIFFICWKLLYLYDSSPPSASSIGYFFRPPLWRWRKMAALPLPAAILDDLISGSRKWGHPRWRPEAEGPPFCATATTGIEKSTPSPGWCHFRRRHLGFKMAAVEMTSGGRRDAREDVLQTSASSMSHAIL